jgi:hypothetical protein
MAAVRQTDEQFLSSAPVRFSESFDVARPAEAVWQELIGDQPLDWCRALSITWTSERPFGIGTIRQAKILGGALTVKERYFLWEEGRRKAFCVVDANLPVFERLAEDYVVEPLGPDRCRLTWTIAMELKGVGKAGGPANALLVKSIFDDTRRHFAATQENPAGMPSADSRASITRHIQFVAVVRIVYGVLAIFAPKVWPKFFRLDPANEDARMWNAFLGSRDIAIGIHSLKVVNDPSRHDDVVLINQACEVGDTILVGKEIRHGRKGFVTFAALVFNAGMHAIWIRVRKLQRD